VQFQNRTMDVADVAAAGGGRASPRRQAVVEVGLVDIPDNIIEEVAATDVAIAVHGKSSFARRTQFSAAVIAVEIPLKVWVHGEQTIHVARLIVVGLLLEGVDPEINVG